MSENGGQQVQIFGRTYHIQGDGDPNQVHEAAELVDEKMNLIASQSHSPDAYRVAVLAALHLADEFLSMRRRADQVQADVQTKAEQINTLLDEVESEEKEGSNPMFQAAG